MNYPSIIGLVISTICIVLLLFSEKYAANPYVKSVWRSSLLFFAMYSLILIVVFVRWRYLQSQVEAFDLNHNGNIEMSEYTAEYAATRAKLFGETSRNFTFFTGAILSFLLAGLTLGFDLIITYARQRENYIKP